MYNFPALSETGDTNWAVTAASDLYVDLGLSVKWAKCNLGATTETDYGDYYAWGEVTGYSENNKEFKWLSYRYATSDEKLTKYCSDSSKGQDGFTDALTTLEKIDDAAYTALGGKFRMPTKAEWTELINNCIWTWDDTKKGYTVTSKIAGYTNKSIFIPAAGRRQWANLTDTSWGNYWSSSLQTEYPEFAWYVQFNSNSGSNQLSHISRSYGQSVRPVSEYRIKQ